MDTKREFIEAEKIEFKVNDKEYRVSCNDCDIYIAHDYNYGSDADGRRGEYRQWIDDCHFDFDDMSIELYDDSVEKWQDVESPSDQLQDAAASALIDFLSMPERIDEL